MHIWLHHIRKINMKGRQSLMFSLLSVSQPLECGVPGLPAGLAPAAGPQVHGQPEDAAQHRHQGQVVAVDRCVDMYK